MTKLNTPAYLTGDYINAIPNCPKDWTEQLEISLNNVKLTFEKMAKAKAAIKADPTKTEAAQLVELDMLYDRVMSAPIENLKAWIKDTEATSVLTNLCIAETFKAANDPQSIALAGEIRQSLKHLSSKQRSAAIQSAIDNGDHAIVSAVLDAPSFLTGVDSGEHDGIKNRYISKHRPELNDQLKAAEILQARAKQLSFAVNKIRTEIITPDEQMTLTVAKHGAAEAAKAVNDFGASQPSNDDSDR